MYGVCGDGRKVCVYGVCGDGRKVGCMVCVVMGGR